MKNKVVKNLAIDELQAIFQNSPSVKKMHKESEKLIKNIQIPPISSPK